MIKVSEVFAALLVTAIVDFSFSEMRRLYLIKFKQVYAHRQRKNKDEFEKLHERNFPRNWIVWFKDLKHRRIENLCAFIEKGKQSVNG